jgi:hypothetical protein
MACYLCHAPTPAGRAERRHIQSGIAYTGWGITKNPTINAWLSGVKRGPRRFYGLRTLCPDCAAKHDAGIRDRRFALIILVVGAALIGFMLLGH